MEREEAACDLVWRANGEFEKRLLFIMNGEDDPGLSAIDNKRRRYARILWALRDFVKIDHDELSELRIYIGSLASALEDLIEGVTDPLFVTKGSKRDSRRTWGSRLQAAHAGDQDVWEAVVVVVADRNPHPVELHVETGAGGDVGEGAIAVIVVEAKRGTRLLVTGPVGSVDQQNVRPAIAIVVEKGASGAESFGQELPAEGSAVVVELNARLRRNVGQPHCGSRPSRERRTSSGQEGPAGHEMLTSPRRMA